MYSPVYRKLSGGDVVGRLFTLKNDVVFPSYNNTNTHEAYEFGNFFCIQLTELEEARVVTVSDSSEDSTA